MSGGRPPRSFPFCSIAAVREMGLPFLVLTASLQSPHTFEDAGE